MTKILGSCQSKLDVEMLPLRFGLQHVLLNLYFLNIIDNGSDLRILEIFAISPVENQLTPVNLISFIFPR